MAQHDDHEAERARRKAAKLDRVRETRIENGMNQVLANPDGREFVWWLLRISGMGLQPAANPEMPFTTAFHCGELNVGQQVMARMLSLNPNAYVAMQQEQEAYGNEPDDASGTGTVILDSGPGDPNYPGV